MATSPMLPGAEPFSASGTPTGVLVLHGFTGCPQSMRPLAQAFADAGFTVELPLLPGHGTTVEDMATTTWSDWSAAAEAAYTDLRERCERVFVAGLSMGGTLTVWLATRHPEIAGIVVVNPSIVPLPPEAVAGLRGLLEQGVEYVPGVGSDIADPDVQESAYERAPVAASLTMIEALGELFPRLGEIRSPLLLLNSPQDHILPAESSDALAAAVSGPVERVSLDRSYHVATLDYDHELIEQKAVGFVRGLSG